MRASAILRVRSRLPSVWTASQRNPHEVPGIVLVDSVFEGQRVGVGGKAMICLGDGVKGKSIYAAYVDSPMTSGYPEVVLRITIK